MVTNVLRNPRKMLSRLKKYLKLVYTKADKSEVNALYSLLYDIVHDLDQTPELFGKQTRQTFSFQWDKLGEGEAMLSDDWFRSNVSRIIADEELLIDRSWFEGKKVLDLGCGGGRWSFGLASLGAEITAVDVNKSALRSTEEALKPFSSKKHRFILSQIETLDAVLPNDNFDLVWSWGVIHHCSSFTKALRTAGNYVKDGGLLYLYLYGRESVPYANDIEKFKRRLYFNSLKSWEEKEKYLLAFAKGDRKRIHQLHDLYGPLVNRRLEFSYIKASLEAMGFVDVLRTVNHTELFVRAAKGHSNEIKSWLHDKPVSNHWLTRYP